MIVAMKFTRMVLDRCLNKPLVIVDKSPWYRWALERPGFLWLGSETKNPKSLDN